MVQRTLVLSAAKPKDSKFTAKELVFKLSLTPSHARQPPFLRALLFALRASHKHLGSIRVFRLTTIRPYTVRMVWRNGLLILYYSFIYIYFLP